MHRVGLNSSAPKLFPSFGKPTRATLVVPLAIVALCLPALVPWVAPKDDRFFIYPYTALLDLLAAVICVWSSKSCKGRERAAWLLLGGHFALLGFSLTLSSSEALFHVPGTRIGTWMVNVLTSLAAVCCLSSLSVGESDVSWMKRTLDAIMATLLGLLIFLTMFSTGPDGFSNYHLQMSVAVAAFLTFCAFAEQQATESPETERLRGIIAIYLVARTLTIFCTNIVQIFWIRNAPDLIFDLLFAVSLVVFAIATARPSWRFRIKLLPSKEMLARTALPAAVLVASVVLGICLSTLYRVVSGAAILLVVLCFVLRTQLLYEKLYTRQTVLQSKASTLEQWALLDHLTGIGNRRFLEQRAEAWLANPECSSAVLLLDTDFFKEINDSMGHAAGDGLLQNIARLLTEEFSASEEACCARIGGDEFAVLLHDTTAARAMGIAEGLRMSFCNIPLHEEVHPTVSIGVALAHGATTLAALLADADAALYQSKENGRNCVELAMPSE